MSEPTSVTDDLGQACELVGRFLFHFAGVERRIDAAVAKLFELTDDAADTLTANIDFSRKVNLIKTMVDLQASDKAPAWRTNGSDLLNAIRGINDPHRQTIPNPSKNRSNHGIGHQQGTQDHG